MVPVNLLLRKTLPEEIHTMNVSDHVPCRKIVTVYIQPSSSAISWLANQNEIEWLEEVLVLTHK